MTPQARQIIREVAADRGLHPLQIVSKSRIRKVFRARIEVAKRLHARGYSSPRIGAILGHDHTTIVYYLGRARRRPKPEPPRTWRKPHIKFLALVPRLKPAKPVQIRKRDGLIPYAGAERYA